MRRGGHDEFNGCHQKGGGYQAKQRRGRGERKKQTGVRGKKKKDKGAWVFQQTGPAAHERNRGKGKQAQHLKRGERNASHQEDKKPMTEPTAPHRRGYQDRRRKKEGGGKPKSHQKESNPRRPLHRRGEKGSPEVRQRVGLWPVLRGASKGRGSLESEKIVGGVLH